MAYPGLEGIVISIQWFPGHMTKARRLIESELKIIDVIVEIVDARIPEASRNPMLNDILGKRRPRLLVLNKADLADPSRTRYWQEYFKKQGLRTVAVHRGMSRKRLQDLLNENILSLGQEKRDRYLKRGAQKVELRAMIVGIPNVGKSTVINGLVGKASATTGQKPGVTRGKQWLRLSDEVELLDTPGILWPKIEDDDVGYRLAITGAVSDDVFSLEEAAFRLLSVMKERYPEQLAMRYHLTDEVMETYEVYDLMQEIGRGRGALLKGGRIDDEKTARLLLKDYRQGKLGPTTLE